MSKRVSLGIFLVAAAVTCALFINFCATVFQCGCQSLWGVADKFCNIHHAHAHGTKGCPWCSFGYSGYVAVFGSILAVQAGCAFGTRFVWPIRLGLTLLAFPVTGGALALILGIWTGYWS